MSPTKKRMLARAGIAVILGVAVQIVAATGFDIQIDGTSVALGLLVGFILGMD